MPRPKSAARNASHAVQLSASPKNEPKSPGRRMASRIVTTPPPQPPRHHVRIRLTATLSTVISDFLPTSGGRRSQDSSATEGDRHVLPVPKVSGNCRVVVGI